MRIRSTSPETTRQVGAVLARLLRPGDLVALSGPLGAGKTCFAQGVARGLGIREVVASPSFVLAKHYRGTPSLLHVDAYRLGAGEEFWDLGLEGELDSSVSVIEWAERVWDALPEARIEVQIAYGDGDERSLSIAGRGHRQERMVAQLEETLSLGNIPETGR